MTSPAVAAAMDSMSLTTEQYNRFRAEYQACETNWRLPYVEFTRVCPCGSGLDVRWINYPRLEDALVCPPCPECPDGS